MTCQRLLHLLDALALLGERITLRVKLGKRLGDPLRQRSELFDLLPPLQSLIPPRNEDNFQRNLALATLNAQGVRGLSGFDADWEILKIAGPYTGMRIGEATGLSAAQRRALLALGARDE